MADTRVKQRREDRQSAFDYSLLLITMCLIGFGMLMIYSASSYTAQVRFNNSAYFLKKQAFGVALGLVAMFFVSRIPYQWYLKPIFIFRFRVITRLYFLAAFLQILVLFIGKEINGAKRWISIAGITFQPSEITKIVVIFVAAYFIQMRPNEMSNIKGLIRVFIPCGILIFFVALENLSTAIVVAAITLGMCFVTAKKKTLYLVFGSAMTAIALMYVKFGEGFRAERFEIWRNVETHPKGYQILQGLYAIASGGLFGSGLGKSMQKLGFIPESHNDMIFSIICEELGLFGAGIVLLMFIIMLWRILTIAMKAPDLFSSLICVGVMLHIAVQVLLNVAVVTNTLPSTGVPLPFISYGGTSVMILMAEIGIVLGISSKCKST